MKYALYITCNASETDFVKIFNSLEVYISGVDFSKDINYCFYEINDNSETKQLVNKIKSQSISSVEGNKKFEDVRIIIDVKIPDDDSKIDAFFYRYLFMLKNKLLREADILIITCNNKYYNKISSFMLFENLFSNSLFAYDTNDKKLKRFATVFSYSSEWLPAMSFEKNEDNGFYDILSLPLYKSKKHFLEIFNHYKLENSNLKFSLQHYGNKKKDEIIRLYFYASVLFWLEGIENAINFVSENASSVPALALILFSIQLKYISKKGKSLNYSAFENLLNVSCDFSESILQIIENIISHSLGGCFLFRLNDNLDKIKDQYVYDDKEIDIESYLRISLVDYSKKGIAEGIKEKGKISSEITLEDIFNFEEIANQEYLDYLSSDESTIHHYGLPTFKSIVQQYKGCFVVKSRGIDTLRKSDICVNFDGNGLRLKNERNICKTHISGTEYDIILPLSKSLYLDKKSEGITSVSFDFNFPTNCEKLEVFFEPCVYNFFLDGVNTIGTELKSKYKSKQRFKEETINQSSVELSQRLKKTLKNNMVVYFYLNSRVMPYRRTEIIAKIMLKVFSILNRDFKALNFVLFGLSKHGITSFVRQYALFYRKGICDYMQHNQLFVVSEDYKSEVLLYGKSLTTSYQHLCTQRFNYGISSNIANVIKHITQKIENFNHSKIKETVLPNNFNMLNRIEIVNNTPILSSKKWYYDKLLTVINNDIHDKYLGCKISNTHVRLNNIHIDSFYECQLLFGNSFWCDIFSERIVEYILCSDLKHSKNPIILYGYETYSECLLLVTKQKLKKILNVDVEYLIFENSKYVTTNEKSKKKIRYFDRVLGKFKEKLKNANFVFINGISTTLSTFEEQLYNQLLCELKIEKFESNNNLAFVIVQVEDATSEKTVSNTYIKMDNEYVYSEKGHLDFIKDKKCGYLISVKAAWYTPSNCPLCFPKEHLKNEVILVETNDTSTVPMTLIKPHKNGSLNCSIAGESLPTSSFLEHMDNQKYLYYCHLNRNGNHHQYYIRTANFVQDNLQEGSELRVWLNKIKDKDICHSVGNTINIIICPSHFSNETFVSAVNEYVFNNQAHLISLNIKKEFRSSFEAKFSNYKTMLELIKKEMPEIEFYINFYYVDDQIVTGATFQRAKSLIRGLVSEYLNNDYSKRFHINIFKSIIVLVNRNSLKSVSSFFDDLKLDESSKKIEIPFYSFINLKTPSIRSYGDSCPICQKVQRLENIVKESSLYSTENFWKNKLLDYQIKNLHQAKDMNNDLLASRGFRRLQCSEIIWNILDQNFNTAEKIKKELKQSILNYLIKKHSREEQVEYLISFIKIMSRPHIIYQENVNMAILQIILELYDLYFLKFYETSQELECFVYTLIKESNASLRYDLYRTIISCLCSLGSNIFYRENGRILLDCYKRGKELESFIEEKDRISFDVFFRFLLKYNMFSNKDSTIKSQKMSEILLSMIEEMNHE